MKGFQVDIICENILTSMQNELNFREYLSVSDQGSIDVFCWGFSRGFSPQNSLEISNPNFQSPWLPFISKWKCWAIYFQMEMLGIYFQIEMLGHLFSMDNLFQVPGLQKGRRWRNTHTRFHWSFHETDRAARPENSTTLQVNVVSRGRDGSIGSFLFSQPSFVRQAKFHGRGVVLGRFMMEIQEMPMRIIVRKI